MHGSTKTRTGDLTLRGPTPYLLGCRCLLAETLVRFRPIAQKSVVSTSPYIERAGACACIPLGKKVTGKIIEFIGRCTRFAGLNSRRAAAEDRLLR